MQGDGVRELLAAAREMGCDYLENEPMRLHTTFKIGGPARVLLFPETEEQITALVQCARANSVRLLTIGNGSNLLVSDKGIDAAVLVMDKQLFCRNGKGRYHFCPGRCVADEGVSHSAGAQPDGAGICLRHSRLLRRRGIYERRCLRW